MVVLNNTAGHHDDQDDEDSDHPDVSYVDEEENTDAKVGFERRKIKVT